VIYRVLGNQNTKPFKRKSMLKIYPFLLILLSSSLSYSQTLIEQREYDYYVKLGLGLKNYEKSGINSTPATYIGKRIDSQLCFSIDLKLEVTSNTSNFVIDLAGNETGVLFPMSSDFNYGDEKAKVAHFSSIWVQPSIGYVSHMGLSDEFGYRETIGYHYFWTEGEIVRENTVTQVQTTCVDSKYYKGGPCLGLDFKIPINGKNIRLENLFVYMKNPVYNVSIFYDIAKSSGIEIGTWQGKDIQAYYLGLVGYFFINE
jgi:hypothetical protein